MCASLVQMSQPPVVLGRRQTNKLSSTNTGALIADIITAMLFATSYPHADGRISHCFYGRIRGLKLPLGAALAEALPVLREKLCGSSYNERCIGEVGTAGRNVAYHIHGECTRAKTQPSAIENAQIAMETKRAKFSYADVLSGAVITDKKQIEILTTPPSQISDAVFRLLDEMRPKPLQALLRTPDWLNSAYHNLTLNSPDVSDIYIVC